MFFRLQINPALPILISIITVGLAGNPTRHSNGIRPIADTTAVANRSANDECDCQSNAHYQDVLVPVWRTEYRTIYRTCYRPETRYQSRTEYQTRHRQVDEIQHYNRFQQI